MEAHEEGSGACEAVEEDGGADSTMTKILLFNNEKEASFISVKPVKDGAIIIDNKKFYVNENEALLLQKRFGFAEPFYILKWDCITPAKLKSKVVEREVELQDLKSVVEGKPVVRDHITNVVFTRDAKNTPESLYKTERLKILGGMLKIKKEMKGYLPLIFGVIIGAIIMLLMIHFKLIKI
jgi:hypothetical protein